MLLKSLSLLLTLTTSVLSHAHHDDPVAPQHVREELLKKWDQEVFISLPYSPKE